MEPYFTVVTPTYNRRDNLERTLDGLARQRFDRPFEVVVVSDGSTDDTDAFLTEAVRSAPFALRPFRQDNAGPARARNRGIQEARGQVVVFVDDDVEPQPGFLAAHAARHDVDPKVAVIGPQSPDPARRRAEPPWIAWEHAQMLRQYEAFRTGRWKEAGPHHFYTGNASVRREHLLATGGFNETFGRQEDVELAFRMQRACGVRFVFDPDAAALHRPNRTFASWLRTPYAYGQLDVSRARAGNASWRIVWGNYHWRNRLTRTAMDAVLPRAGWGDPVRSLLLGVARAAWAVRIPDAAVFGALSAIYNLRYLEGARDELGGWPALRDVLAWDRADPRVSTDTPVTPDTGAAA